MEVSDIVSIVCTIISALCAGISFNYYKKTVNIINGNYYKKALKRVRQKSGNNSVNNIGDNNTF